MKELIKKTETENAKKETTLLDLDSIAEGIANVTDGCISPTLWKMLKKAEKEKLGSPDKPLSDLVPVSSEHEEKYVHYGDEEGQAITLEADVILLLSYRFKEDDIANRLYEAHKDSLEGYARMLFKRHCGRKEKEDCTNLVWAAYLEHLKEYCVIVQGVVYMSTDPYVFSRKLSLADRKERALMTLPVAMPPDVLQAEDSIRKRLRMENILLEEVTVEMLADRMTARERNNVSPETLLMILRQNVVVAKRACSGRFHGDDGIAGFEDSLSELNQSGTASPEEEVFRKEIHNLVQKALAPFLEKEMMENILYKYCVEKELKIKDLAKLYEVSPNKISTMKKDVLELLKTALKDYAE